MLGHRGCRLGNTYPEISEMQARAIIEAALNLKAKGITAIPEIMIPLTEHSQEMKMQEDYRSQYNAEKVFEERKDSMIYLVGTMIEIPRAALTADEIAESAEFFSFGTNDLTQMTFGYSRDDAGKFLAGLPEKGNSERMIHSRYLTRKVLDNWLKWLLKEVAKPARKSNWEFVVNMVVNQVQLSSAT